MGLRLINHNSSQCRSLLSEACQKHCWNQWISEKTTHSWMLANDWDIIVYLVRLCVERRGREQDVLAMLCEQGSDVFIRWKPCVPREKLPSQSWGKQDKMALFCLEDAAKARIMKQNCDSSTTEHFVNTYAVLSTCLNLEAVTHCLMFSWGNK